MAQALHAGDDPAVAQLSTKLLREMEQRALSRRGGQGVCVIESYKDFEKPPCTCYKTNGVSL